MLYAFDARKAVEIYRRIGVDILLPVLQSISEAGKRQNLVRTHSHG